MPRKVTIPRLCQWIVTIIRWNCGAWRILIPKRKRPYLTPEGEIHYLLPSRYPALRDGFNRYSLFLYFIASRVDVMYAKAHAGASLADAFDSREDYLAVFNQSVTITDQLLGKIRALVPASVPIFSFTVDPGQPESREFRRLSDQHGITFIDGVAQAIANVEAAGDSVKAADGGHWNETGHRIAGEHLAKALTPLLEATPKNHSSSSALRTTSPGNPR